MVLRNLSRDTIFTFFGFPGTILYCVVQDFGDSIVIVRHAASSGAEAVDVWLSV